jgi:aquaporin Z
MIDALKNHWPEYLIEAWCLGTFMLSACGFGVLLFNASSPLAYLDFDLRNILMGLAMGATAVGIITSPMGRRSGAHFNPAVTLTFFRLGKINSFDTIYYIFFQFIGGTIGVLLSWLLLGDLLADTPVNFVVTNPGSYPLSVAFAAEVAISFFMMVAILFTSDNEKLSRLTPLIAGGLLALYIPIESPISGTSMNPARSFASASVAGQWKGLWIYFTAPTLAMLTAAECFVRMRGLKRVLCAKLDHCGRARCIFNCEFGSLRNRRDVEAQRLIGQEQRGLKADEREQINLCVSAVKTKI